MENILIVIEDIKENISSDVYNDFVSMSNDFLQNEELNKLMNEK